MNLRKPIKSALAYSLYYTYILNIIRKIKKNHVIILMYHRFSDKDEPFKTKKSVFENQIKYLKTKYNFISLSHYSEFLNGQRVDLPENSLIITIDDGFKDNYDYAFPILVKYICFLFLEKNMFVFFNL